MHVAATLPIYWPTTPLGYGLQLCSCDVNATRPIFGPDGGDRPGAQMCASVFSCSPSPLRLPRDFDGRRRRAAESSELRLSTREKEMFTPATCISLGYAAPYPCHPLAPPVVTRCRVLRGKVFRA
jgi:hypothetical protein